MTGSDEPRYFVEVKTPTREAVLEAERKRNQELLFVYGTLKRGYGLNNIINNTVSRGGQGEFVCEAITEKNYRMYHAGYPVVTEEEIAPVKGELYAVDPSVFRELDQIEGAYDRKRVTIRCNDEGPTSIEAWMYIGKWDTGRQYVIRPEGYFEWSRNEKYFSVYNPERED